MNEDWKFKSKTEYRIYRVYMFILYIILNISVSLGIINFYYFYGNLKEMSDEQYYSSCIGIIFFVVAILLGIEMLVAYLFKFDGLFLPIRRNNGKAKNRRVYLIPSRRRNQNIIVVDADKDEIAAVGVIDETYTFDINDIEFKEGRTLQMQRITDEELEMSTYEEIMLDREYRRVANQERRIKTDKPTED